jgi:hypothetical protein
MAHAQGCRIESGFMVDPRASSPLLPRPPAQIEVINLFGPLLDLLGPMISWSIPPAAS